MGTDHKKETRYKYILYLALFAVILLRHIPMTMISDDRYNLAAHAGMSLRSIFLEKYQTNGRIFTDMLAEFCYFCMPLWLWKLLDSLVYVGIAKLTARIFTGETAAETFAVCTAVLLFPFSYLRSAGYIATSANYVYPLAALLLAILPIRIAMERDAGDRAGACPWYLYAAAVCGILYATNHDQYAAVLTGTLLMLGGYLLYSVLRGGGSGSRYGQRALLHSAGALLLTACSWMVQWRIPGHVHRMTDTAEMELYLPQYAGWSVWKKLYHGFSSTAARMIFTQEGLVSLLLLLLLVLALAEGSAVMKVTGCLPAALHVLIREAGYKRFVIFYDYAFKQPEIGSVRADLKYALTLALSAAMILSIAAALGCLCRNRERKLLIGLLLLLGAASRVMMGFSPTLYASGTRTFIFLLFSVGISCILLLREILERKDRALRILGLAAFAAAFLLP